MMDVEEENILKTIFKDTFPDSWRENPSVSHCLQELSSYGLDRINKEPEMLSEEKNIILEQTQDLVFHNYKTFIEAANCSREIFQDFNIVERHLDAVSQQLPNFIEKCQRFSKKSQEINTNRRLNTMTLSRHTQLLEILEMPQLMDTCVRNNYYDEALDLSSYVFHLDKKYSSIPIVTVIAREVRESMRLMLGQLIQQLRTNIQLPQCLKVISYLRRMDVFTEDELRIKFLQARDSWFQSVLSTIQSTDPYNHITKVIEVSRVHLFDILTQYRAIFSDDDPVLMTGQKDMSCNRAAISHSWVFQKVSQFLNMLESDLEREMGGRIDSLLGQCMYFGLSFSRVGADFRSLLVPLFERAVLSGFKKSTIEIANRFQETMQSFVLTATPTIMVSSVLAASTAAQDKYHPPLSLLEFKPLAELCNGFLVAFNNLRLLAPLSLVGDVGSELHDCLLVTSKTIVDFNRTEEASMTAREQEIFSKFSILYARELVPFVDLCYGAIFPQQQLAQVLGLSLTEFGKLKNVGQLDIDAILVPMLFLLPEPEKYDSIGTVISERIQDEILHKSQAMESEVADAEENKSMVVDTNELEKDVVLDTAPLKDVAADQKDDDLGEADVQN